MRFKLCVQNHFLPWGFGDRNQVGMRLGLRDGNQVKMRLGKLSWNEMELNSIESFPLLQTKDLQCHWFEGSVFTWGFSYPCVGF